MASAAVLRALSFSLNSVSFRVIRRVSNSSSLGWRMVSSSRGSSMIRNDRFAGATGEVLTPIPEGGLGEVAAMIDGHRFTASAREVHGRAVARGKLVRIRQMAAATLLVESEET